MFVGIDWRLGAGRWRCMSVPQPSEDV